MWGAWGPRRLWPSPTRCSTCGFWSVILQTPCHQSQVSTRFDPFRFVHSALVHPVVDRHPAKATELDVKARLRSAMISDDQRCHGERKSKAQGSAASQDSLIHHKFLLLLDRSKNIKNIRTNQKELTKEPRVEVWNIYWVMLLGDIGISSPLSWDWSFRGQNFLHHLHQPRFSNLPQETSTTS